MLMKLFRKVSVIEGITTLMLFLLAMPLKYGFGYEALIRPFGMAHGIAFVAYLGLMAAAFSAARIGPGGWLRSTLAAFVPFGTFFNDHWLKRQSGEAPGGLSQPALAAIAVLSLGAAALAGSLGPAAQNTALRTQAAAPAQDRDSLVMAGFARIPAQQVALPWDDSRALWLGLRRDLPAGAETLFADDSRAFALVPAQESPAAAGAAYDRRFLIAAAGLALRQHNRDTGPGWGPERLVAEARLTAGGNPAREATLAQLLLLP